MKHSAKISLFFCIRFFMKSSECQKLLFWLMMCRTPFYWTSNEHRTTSFEHRTNLNMFFYWWSNSNTLFLASNDLISSFEPDRAFTRFTKMLQHQFFKHQTNSNMFIFGRRTYFWLLVHRTSNLMGPSLNLQNCLSNRLEHCFFEHRTNLNVFIFW